MPKIVEVPGLGDVEFPDSMSIEQINSAIETDILPRIGQADAPAGRGGILPSLAEGLATSFTGVPLGIAGIYSPSPEKTPAGKLSIASEKAVQDILGIDPTKEATTAESVAGGLGSLASFLIPGTAATKLARGLGAEAKVAGRVGMGAAGAQAVPLGVSEQVQRRMAEEAETGVRVSDEDRMESQLLGGAIGASELIPLRRFFGPLEEILSKVPLSKAGEVGETLKRGFARAVRSGTEEGAQEALSQISQNLVAQGYYNPDLDVTEGLLSSAVAGGGAGATLDVILNLVSGRKGANIRTARTQLAQSQQQEAREKGPQDVRGEAVLGLETVRAAAPTGEIKIKINTPKTGVKSFDIVDAQDKTVASFRNPDSAFLAAEQYEADAPGAVTFIRPTISQMSGIKKRDKKEGEKKEEAKPGLQIPKPSRPSIFPPLSAGTTPQAAPAPQAAPVAQAAAAPAGTQPAPVEKPIIKKGRKRIAPVEAPVVAGAPIPSAPAAPPVSTTAAEIPAPPPSPAMDFGTADERAAIRREIAPEAETFRDMTPEQQAAYNAELDRRFPGRTYSVTPPAPQAAPAQTPPVAPTEAPTKAEKKKRVPIEDKLYKPSVRALFKPIVTSPEGQQKLQAFEANRAAVAKGLNERLSPIMGKNARIELVDAVTGVDQRTGRSIIAEGTVSNKGDIIFLSYNIFDPDLTTDQMVDKIFDVMNHEVIHSISNSGLFRGNELQTLFNAGKRIKYRGNKFTYYDRAEQMYRNVKGYTEEMIQEEAVAEMFRDARAGKLKLEGTPKGIFGRVVEFLKRIFNGFRDAKVGKIFADIESGKIGTREPVYGENINTQTAEGADIGVKKLSIVPDYKPQNTVKAYKLFRIKKGEPGKLFPLYVDANTPVPIGTWVEAIAGKMVGDKVKAAGAGGSLAYRPGWHSGDSPMATHIGGKKVNGKLTVRKPDQVWAEVEVPADKDWQSIANSRAPIVKSGPNKGKITASKAHITDQIPFDGFYRYKTNSNMTGNWIISGQIKVNRVLSDEEVAALGEQMGVRDLPRDEPRIDAGISYQPSTAGSKFSIPAQLTGESEQEFRRWFKNSEAVNEDGGPKVFYHGRPRPLRQGQFNRAASGALPGEDGPYYFSPRKRFAEDYALTDLTKGGDRKATKTGTMYPVFLSVQNAWDYKNPDHVNAVSTHVADQRLRKQFRTGGAFDERAYNDFKSLSPSEYNRSIGIALQYIPMELQDGSWTAIEQDDVQRAIRDLGFDGFYLVEGGVRNLAVYSPQQIKSIYNQFEPGTETSRKLSVIPPYPDDTTSTVYIREAAAQPASASSVRLKTTGKVTVGEIAKAFDAITAKGDITDPADYNRIVDAIVSEVEYQKQQAQSGVGWYDNDVDLVFDILSSEFPQLKDPFYGAQNRQLFTIIAGVMSNGMKARPNVTMAAMNFAHYMNTGKFSEVNPFTGKGWNQRTNIMSGQIRMLNSMMADPRFNVAPGSNMTREEKFLEWVFSEHSVRDLNNMRAKHGVKSPAKIGSVDTMRLGAYAFGPKFGPFILNLNGRTDETVDSWASRSFYRHMGRLLAKDGKKTNDAPLTGADREAMKRALRDIATATNLSSRDVQAVLWFYEKALYNDLGMKIPLEVFSDGAKDYVKQYGKDKVNDATADDRTRAIARSGQEAGARTTAATPSGVAEPTTVAAEKRTALDIADAAARTGEASKAEADIANQAVKNAVRKLSIPPQNVPMPPSLADANSRIFAGTKIPTTVGERLMEVFGGLGSGEGRVSLADRFRTLYVQKSGQIEKRERQAYLQGLLNANEAQFSEYSAIAANDMAARGSHYSLEIAYNGAPTIMGLDAKGNAVPLSEGADPNSAYMIVNEGQQDTLFKILEKIYAGGEGGQSLIEQFQTYALAQVSKRRLSEGKDVPSDITDQYIADADALGEQYPVIKEAFESYQRYNKKLLEAVRDSGFLSQELFEEFTDEQNYYSMYRQLEEGDVVQELSGGMGSRIRFKAYEGSTTGNLMADPIVAMMHNSAFWTNVILRTLATQKSFRVGEATGVVKRLRPFEDGDGNVTIETPSAAEGYDPKVFYTYVNGKEIPFASKDPLFTIGLSGNDFVAPGLFLEMMGVPSNFLREMVTRDPGFMVANLLRDSVSTWVLAGSGANPLQTFKGFVSALRSSSSFNALRSYGIVGSFDEAQKPIGKIVEGMRGKLTKVQGLPSMNQALKSGWDKLGSLSEASDAATRIAVYEAAKRDGASDFTAAYRALSIMNFSRSGHSAGLRAFTKLVPFLNARIQGFDVLYKGVKAAAGVVTGQQQLEFERQRGTHVLVRGMGLMAAAMALALMNGDDEDYKQLPPYIKDANILIPVPGTKGKYIQIPKPFEAGFLFMTVPTAFYDVAMGDRSMRSATKLMFNQFSSTFGFNPIPQAFLPAVENVLNRDFYTGQPLISAGMEKLDPSLQYSPSTSYVARGLSELSSFLPLNYDFEEGRFVPISPIKLDNLITGYGGPIASYISMALGGMTYAFGTDNQGLPVAGSELPVIRRFFIDAQDKQPQTAAEAYELYQLVDKVNRTMSRLKKSGDTEALKEYREENINILRAGKQVRKMADNLNNIRAQIRRLENEKTMGREEKLNKLRELRAREIRITRNIDQINQQLGR